MQKQTISDEHPELSTADKNWLKLAELAKADASSQDKKHPNESALIPNTGLEGGSARETDIVQNRMANNPQQKEDETTLNS